MTSNNHNGGPTGSDTGTVHRVLRILSSFSEQERWALSELARSLNLPRASAHRLLRLCMSQGYVDQDSEGLYTPGLELYRLAGKLAADMPINRLAEPIVEQLCNATQETALMALLLPGELRMFFSHIASPKHPMRYAIEANRSYSLAWGASGRAILALLTAEEIDTVIRRAEPSPLDGRPLDEQELRASLATIRRQGWALTNGQRSAGAFGVAVPIYGANGKVCADVTLTIPDFRFSTHDLGGLLELLRNAAAEITRRLGVGKSVRAAQPSF